MGDAWRALGFPHHHYATITLMCLVNNFGYRRMRVILLLVRFGVRRRPALPGISDVRARLHELNLCGGGHHRRIHGVLDPLAD